MNERVIESERLVERFQRGDEKAFDELVSAWDGPLFALTDRLLGDREEAEEARQASWVKVYLGLAGFERRSRFDTWLFRIAVHQCRDQSRRRLLEARRRVELIDSESFEDPALSPDVAAEREEQRERVALAICSLPEEERECLVLRHYHDLPVVEIAAALGLPRTTVQSRLKRAFERLQRRLRSVSLRTEDTR